MMKLQPGFPLPAGLIISVGNFFLDWRIAKDSAEWLNILGSFLLPPTLLSDILNILGWADIRKHLLSNSFRLFDFAKLVCSNFLSWGKNPSDFKISSTLFCEKLASISLYIFIVSSSTAVGCLSNKSLVGLISGKCFSRSHLH